MLFHLIRFQINQASSKDGKEGGVELVQPPAGSKPGDRVFFEEFEDQVAVDQMNPKKKIWETVQPGKLGDSGPTSVFELTRWMFQH
jgi:hypothetical protein